MADSPKVMSKVWICGGWARCQRWALRRVLGAVHFLSKQENQRISFSQLQSSSTGMGAPAFCVINLQNKSLELNEGGARKNGNFRSSWNSTRSRELLHCLCKGCLNVLNPQLPPYCTAPSRAPPRAQGKAGDAAGTAASPAQGEAQTAPEEIPPACVGRGQQHKQLLVSFFPSTCFQGFYLSSADRKAGLERAQPVTSSQQMLLQQRFLAALVGSMLGVGVGCSSHG